jgi:glycosyltransferase involved in cell wall biosynthesis
MTRGLSEEKLAVVPYGVDLEAFHPRPPGDEVDAPFRILFAGRISLQKGVPYLLQAYNRLRGGSSSIELWLAGKMDRELSRLLHAERLPVRVLGQLSRERLAEVYREVSVFVLPSLQEGLATVLAQALASGLPVIATPNSGAEDLIEDGLEGFIVPPRSSDALQEMIEMLLLDPMRRQEMGQRARARAELLGGWSGYAAVAEAAYESIR